MRTFKGSKNTVKAGKSFNHVVRLTTEGDEYAISFTLTFDPNLLTFKTVEIAKEARTFVLTVNALRVNEGLLGILLDASHSLSSGQDIIDLIKVKFVASPYGATAETNINVFNGFVPLTISDGLGNALPSTVQTGRVKIK